MALSGKTVQPRLVARFDWATVYLYVVLCVGCYASYLGAPLQSILAVGALLALPNFAKSGQQPSSPVEIGAHLVMALIFAFLAHIVGWGIAGVIGS